MAYVKTNWLARVGTALNRFLKTNETSTEVELTNDPTGVSVPGTPFTVTNMNKIEQGIYDAHVTADANASNLLANVNQGVKTTSSPTFANATIAGHNIDSELDTLNGRVNQGVKTTDSPTFASVNTTNGPNKPVDNNDASMPSVGIGGFSYAVGSAGAGAYPSITIGSGGTWVYIANSTLTTTTSVQVGRIAGGSSVQGLIPGDSSNLAYVSVIAWRIS